MYRNIVVIKYKYKLSDYKLSVYIYRNIVDVFVEVKFATPMIFRAFFLLTHRPVAPGVAEIQHRWRGRSGVVLRGWDCCCESDLVPYIYIYVYIYICIYIYIWLVVSACRRKPPSTSHQAAPPQTPMLQSFSQLYGMGSFPQLDLRLQKGFNIWIPNYMWPCGRYAGNLLPTLPLVSFREVETTSQNSSLGYSNSRASDLHWFLSAQALSRYDISVPSSHWQSLLLKNQLKHLWHRSYMLYTPCTSDSPSCGSVPGRDSHVDGYLPRYVEHASLRQMVSSLIQNIQDTCPLDWLSGSFAVHNSFYSGDTSLQSLLYISHIPPFQPTHLELVELECSGFLNWKGHSSGVPGSWIEAGL